MKPLYLASIIVNFLIFFFVTILIYFVLFLIYSHYQTNLRNAQKNRLKGMFTNYINKKEKRKISVRKLTSRTGIEAISELIDDISEEDAGKLKEYLAELKFNSSVQKRLHTMNENSLTYIIKLIGNLQMQDMAEPIVVAIYRHKKSLDLQYVGLEALAKLGYDEGLIRIFNDTSLHINLTYRAFQNIFIVYSGNKVEFYKRMLQVNDNYVVRIIVKVIGNEHIKDLVKEIRSFLHSNSKDMRISTINTLGILKDKKSYHEIKKFCKDEEWEVRSAAVKAIAQIDLEASVTSLMEGLKDSEWWVRYNCAQALAQHKMIDQIYEEIARSEDKFAKEILRYAIEKRDFDRYEMMEKVKIS